MAKMKSSGSSKSVSGNSQYFPQLPAFKPTFWSGWGQMEEPTVAGSQEKTGNMLNGNKGFMGTKHKCPNCG